MLLIVCFPSGRVLAINILSIDDMRSSLLNNSFNGCGFLEYDKSKPFWYTSHWISLYNVIFDWTKFLEIIVKVLFSRTTNTTYKYFPCFNILSRIFLSGRSIRLWLGSISIIWHLFLTCES